MTEREPQTPLRLEIVPGVIAAYASQTVVILEPLDGSEVRVRDVASGKEKIVPVCELSGAALGLSRKDTQRRLETLRGVTRDEWLRARRRERVVMRLIRSDGEIAKQVTRASRALGLSRSSIYRLLRQYRQAAQTSSLLVGHRGTPKQHRRLSSEREALVTRAMEEKYLVRPRMTISGLKEEIRIRCLRASLKPVSRKAIEMRIAQNMLSTPDWGSVFKHVTCAARQLLSILQTKTRVTPVGARRRDVAYNCAATRDALKGMSYEDPDHVKVGDKLFKRKPG